MIMFNLNCAEEKFNVTEEFCLNFENNTEEPEYADIEAEVSSFNFIISVTEHTIPILLSFYIGSWSDCFGRCIT